MDIEMSNLIAVKDNEMLRRPIHNFEIKEVVFQMDKRKAPWPNGFKGAFFQDS